MPTKRVAKPVTVAELSALRAQAAKNPAAAYQMLVNRGYGYALLGLGVAKENYITGQVAIDFARTAAADQGHPLSDQNIAVTPRGSPALAG